MEIRRRSGCLKRFLLPVLAVAANVAAIAAPPAAPSDVVVFAPGYGRPHLAWKDNSSDETRFFVEVYAAQDGSFVTSSESRPNIEVTRFTGGEGGAFIFRIRAEKGAEVSAWVQADPFTVPNADFSMGVPDGSGQSHALPSQEGLGGIEGDPVEFTIPKVGAVVPTSYFLEGFPDGFAIDNTGKITGTMPPAGVSTRGFYGAIAGGVTYKQIFNFRSESAETVPLVVDPIPPASVTAGSSASVELNDIFINPEWPSLVRFNTTLGSFNAVLSKLATPLTVANFLSYLRKGDYTTSVIHRSSSDFVVQGGGFNQLADRTSADWKPFSTVTPVRNEPGFTNERGTIAMAKVGGDPDSATSQWFVSTGVTNPANLDFQNSGFTAFGKVLDNGMDVVDAINDLPIKTYNVRLQGSGTQSLSGIPVNNPTPPSTLTAAFEVVLQSVEELETLTYSVESNSNPSVVTAAIGGRLLNLAGLAVGTSTIVVKATDAEMETVLGSIEVTVTPAPPPPPPADTTAPTTRITAPGTKGKLPDSGKLRIAGSATDNKALSRWQYRLNGKGWKLGGSLAGTSASFAKKISGFRLNANTLEIRVYDSSGRVSATVKRKITLK